MAENVYELMLKYKNTLKCNQVESQGKRADITAQCYVIITHQYYVQLHPKTAPV